MTHTISAFEKELAELINKHSQENGSNTPDHILAAYLVRCMDNYNSTVIERAYFYDRMDVPGGQVSMGRRPDILDHTIRNFQQIHERMTQWFKDHPEEESKIVRQLGQVSALSAAYGGKESTPCPSDSSTGSPDPTSVFTETGSISSETTKPDEEEKDKPKSAEESPTR